MYTESITTAQLEAARERNMPAYIAAFSLLCVLSRQEGRCIDGAAEALKQLPNSEIKAAIRAMRTISDGHFPIDEMVRFLRVEIMGKEQGR